MYDFADLVDRVRSGVVHIEYFLGNDRVGSGSGFLCRGYLVTDNHVFRGPANSTVLLAWQPDLDPASRTGLNMSHADFQQRLVSGSDEDNYDFAIIDVPQLRETDAFNFELASPVGKRVGEPIALLGFPLEHRNLVCHTGVISSFYQRGPAKVIQIDASVNQSNSGGPLLDPREGNVIGIITRKGTGLSNLFDQLLSVFDENMKVLDRVKGMIGLGGVDPVAALITGQAQMKALAKEIQRSANVGIGYAFSVEHIMQEEVLK